MRVEGPLTAADFAEPKAKHADLIAEIEAAQHPSEALWWRAFDALNQPPPPGPNGHENSPEYQDFHRRGILFRGCVSTGKWAQASLYLLSDANPEVVAKNIAIAALRRAG